MRRNNNDSYECVYRHRDIDVPLVHVFVVVLDDDDE